MAAIRSLMRFASYREPACAAVIQRVLAIPDKRSRRAVVSHLSGAEINALVAAPDRTTWIGRRDHALLVVDLQTGLRVSELTALRRRDVVFGAGAHLRCHGKGRKDRATPLTRHTIAVLKPWMAERSGSDDDAVFQPEAGKEWPLRHCAADDGGPSSHGPAPVVAPTFRLSPRCRRRPDAERTFGERHLGVDLPAGVLAGVPERRVDVPLDLVDGAGLPEAGCR